MLCDANATMLMLFVFCSARTPLGPFEMTSDCNSVSEVGIVYATIQPRVDDLRRMVVEELVQKAARFPSALILTPVTGVVRTVLFCSATESDTQNAHQQ